MKDSQDLKQILKIEGIETINIQKFIDIVRGNHDLGLSMLSLFKEQAYLYLKNLNQTYKGNETDAKLFFAANHTLKGAALSIAADHIVDKANEIEYILQLDETVSQDVFDDLIHKTQDILKYISAIEARQKSLKI